MTVEVTSHDRDAELCHLYDKRDAYAAAGIPVHLFIDREDLSVTVFSQPEDGRYRSSTSRPFGADLELPDPVGFTLPTEELKDLAR
jgi:Uma2 family endonuclease